jgi:hypothetical protein
MAIDLGIKQSVIRQDTLMSVISFLLYLPVIVGLVRLRSVGFAILQDRTFLLSGAIWLIVYAVVGLARNQRKRQRWVLRVVEELSKEASSHLEVETIASSVRVVEHHMITIAETTKSLEQLIAKGHLAGAKLAKVDGKLILKPIKINSDNFS